MNRLNGKKAICFGDSITWYDGKPYNWGKEQGRIAVGYESYLRQAGMYVQNEGISDATIRIIREHIYQTNIQNYDYVFITSGANDSRYGIPVGKSKEKGSIFDTKTFMGCLQDIVEHVQFYNMGETVLLTPIKGWIYAPDGYEYNKANDGEVEEEYAQAIIEVATFYKCILCDWYHKSGIEKETMSQFINDPDPPGNTLYSFHPSTLGYKKMAEVLLPCLQNNQ